MNIKTILKGSVAGAALVALSAPIAEQAQAKPEVTVYGHVNKFFAVAGDGAGISNGVVDNDQSSTRFGFRAKGKVTESITVGANLEQEIESETSNGDFTNDGAGATGGGTAVSSERKALVWIEHKQFGRVTIGQQAELADGIDQGEDLSITKIISNASIDLNLAGFNFVIEGSDTLSVLELDEAVNSFDPGRDDAAKYETPTIFGFKAAGLYNNDGTAEARLRYSGKLGAFRIKARGVFSAQQTGSVSGDLNPGAGDGNLYAGVISVKHDSGIGISGTYSFFDFEDTSDRNTAFGLYTKLFWDTDLTGLGTTGFAIDFQYSEDVGADGIFGKSAGFTIAQTLKGAGAEFFASYRYYDAQITDGAVTALGGGATPGSTELDAIHAGFIGSRIKF